MDIHAGNLSLILFVVTLVHLWIPSPIAPLSKAFSPSNGSVGAFSTLWFGFLSFFVVTFNMSLLLAENPCHICTHLTVSHPGPSHRDLLLAAVVLAFVKTR